MIIKTPTLADVAALSELACTCFCETFAHLYPPEDLEVFLKDSYAPDILAREIADPRYFWCLVYEGEAMLAYLMCAPVSLPHDEADPATQGELKRLYIRQSHQGRGLGKHLMSIGLEYLEGRYPNAAQWIGVWSENHKAQELYRAYGFEKVGEYGFPVGQTLDREYILRRTLS